MVGYSVFNIRVQYSYQLSPLPPSLSPSVLISGSYFVLRDYSLIGLKEEQWTNFTAFRPMEKILDI